MGIQEEFVEVEEWWELLDGGLEGAVEVGKTGNFPGHCPGPPLGCCLELKGSIDR